MTQTADKRLVTESAIGLAMKPTGVAATDYANIMAAHTALPSDGGIIQLHGDGAEGGYDIGTNVLAFTKPTTLRGAGGSLTDNDVDVFPSSARTTIKSSSSNGIALSLTGSGHVLEDFALVNSSPLGVASGSIGIKADTGAYLRMHQVTVQGFYDCAHIKQWAYTITACHFFDPVRYGVYCYQTDSEVYDNGDCVWMGNYFAMMSRTGVVADAAFRWESGGGTRFIGNKIVGEQTWYGATAGTFHYGLDFVPDDGVSTVELEVAGSNISSCDTASIRIGQKGPLNTGQFGRVTIVGMTSQGYGSSAVGVLITAADFAHVNSIRNIIVDDCSFHHFDVGVKVVFATNVTIGKNRHDDVTKPIILGDSAGTGQAPYSVHVAPQQTGHATLTGVSANNLDIVTDYRVMGTGNGYDEEVVYEYQRQVTISASSTWTANQFTIEIPVSGCAILEVELIGINSNSSQNSFADVPAGHRQRRALHRLNATSDATGTIVVTTVGTDETVGVNHAKVALQYVTSTATQVGIQVQTTDAALPRWRGILRVRVRGQVKRFRKGA